MTVIVMGVKDQTVAVKESVGEIADIIDSMEDTTHVLLTELNGDAVLIHRDMIDLATR